MSLVKRRTGASTAWAIAASLTAIAIFGAAVPVRAQEASVQEIRLRKLEADMRDVQRQSQPGTSVVAAGGLPAATPLTDLLTRMDAVEAQVARITAQNEEIANRQRQIEMRLGMTPAAASGPAPTSTPTPTVPAPARLESDKSATANNISAMTAGAADRSATDKSGAARPTGPARPSAARVAAVKAVIKPQTGDASDDEYSYGYRLYTAKFYPEAEQQLKLTIDKYPSDARISRARNLLGRTYLDDGKPREAAPWFLQNYKSDPHGPRAADSLLGLAGAMRQLGDSSRACIALHEFADNYSAEAKGRLRQDYAATRSGLTCN
jgi:TolA-binding protein